MTRLLLDGHLAPVTSELGFIERPARVAVEAYVSWQERIEGEPFEPPHLEGAVVETHYGPDVPPPPPPLPPGEPVFDVREVDGAIADVLAQLLPLSTSPRRYAFVATDSPWTAYFDNGWGGTDAFPPMSFLARELGCRALRVVAGANAALLEVYGPRQTDWLNVARAVGAVRDGNRWTFVDQGERLPFENAPAYGARKIRDRVTIAMIAEYAGHLEVRAFDESFYVKPAFVLERRRAPFRDEREYSLEEAQAAGEHVAPPLAVPHRAGLLGRVRGLLPGRG